MRCHICDRVLDEPQWNSEHEDFEPCPPCLLVIQDTLDGFRDKPYADEDELPSEDHMAYIYRVLGYTYEPE